MPVGNLNNNGVTPSYNSVVDSGSKNEPKTKSNSEDAGAPVQAGGAANSSITMLDTKEEEVRRRKELIESIEIAMADAVKKLRETTSSPV